VIVRGQGGWWGSLDLPAVVGVDEGCGGGGVAGEIRLNLRKGVPGFGGLCPYRSTREVVLVGDGGGVAGLAVVGSAGLDGGDGAMAVAEISVAGLVGVRGPGSATLIAEVVVDLLLRDDEDFFLSGGAGEQALVDEGGVGSGLIIVRGGYLGGELLRR